MNIGNDIDVPEELLQQILTGNYDFNMKTDGKQQINIFSFLPPVDQNGDFLPCFSEIKDSSGEKILQYRPCKNKHAFSC